MICHCTVCGSTFNASVIRSKYEIPCKCPDCGKKVSAPHTPAVRPATDEEIKEYEAFRKSEADRVYKELHKDFDWYGNKPTWEHKPGT